MYMYKANNKKNNIITKKFMLVTKISNKVHKLTIYKKTIFDSMYLEY